MENSINETKKEEEISVIAKRYENVALPSNTLSPQFGHISIFLSCSFTITPPHMLLGFINLKRSRDIVKSLRGNMENSINETKKEEEISVIHIFQHPNLLSHNTSLMK